MEYPDVFFVFLMLWLILSYISYLSYPVSVGWWFLCCSIHPLPDPHWIQALLNYDTLDAETKSLVDERMKGYKDPKDTWLSSLKERENVVSRDASIAFTSFVNVFGGEKKNGIIFGKKLKSNIWIPKI